MCENAISDTECLSKFPTVTSCSKDGIGARLCRKRCNLCYEPGELLARDSESLLQPFDFTQPVKMREKRGVDGQVPLTARRT